MYIGGAVCTSGKFTVDGSVAATPGTGGAALAIAIPTEVATLIF